MHGLFETLRLRSVTLRNRIGMSPMCQYSSVDGYANDWHAVHLVSRAVGGVGLILTEAAAVEARGRISPDDLGIWKDDHVSGLAAIAEQIRAHGAAPGMQIAHAGRKASTAAPFRGRRPLDSTEGGWEIVGPSRVPFAEGHPVPQELTVPEIQTIVESFAAAARRADQAGFDVLEIHGAHGYLISSFLSPLANKRTDAYGGGFDGRVRLLLETVDCVRAAWPEHKPLLVRVSATDWSEGGWTANDTVALARLLVDCGVDLLDCSSGGNDPKAPVPRHPGYQVPFADRVRHETGLPTAAVGLITEPAQAAELIANGRADLVLLGRELLRDPYWPLHAAKRLSAPVGIPDQYGRAF